MTTAAGDHSGCFQGGGVLGRIPASRLDAFGVAALNFYPLPNATDSTQTNYTNTVPSTKSHSRQDTLRGDYQLSPNLRMTGKIITQDATRTPNSPDTRFGNAASNILNGFNEVVDWVPLQYQVSSAVNYSINPSTFLEIGYGFFGMTSRQR